MKQGKKNAREWRFGMKAHVGTDRTGLVHTLVTTHAGAADVTQLPQLLHGRERELNGDQAYRSEMHRLAAKHRRALPCEPSSSPRPTSERAPAPAQPPALGDPKWCCGHAELTKSRLHARLCRASLAAC